MADTFEEDLVARLRARAALSVLVEQRIWWIERARDSALPAIVLQGAAPGRAYAHGGPIALANPRVQFDIYAETYLSATLVKRALIAAVEAKGTTAGTVFKGGFLEMERDWAPETPGEGDKVNRITLHFTIWHQPSA